MELITFVGNFKPRKGLWNLLRAMVDVNNFNAGVKLVVIGRVDFHDDEYLSAIDYITENALNVEFVGTVSETKLIDYYRKAKLNILPSETQPHNFEGFGLVHVEANACGTLTIGSKNSGNEDAILNGNGYLIEFGDARSLSKIIIDVFSANEFSPTNLNDILDWPDVARKYEKLFNRIAGIRHMGIPKAQA